MQPHQVVEAVSAVLSGLEQVGISQRREFLPRVGHGDIGEDGSLDRRDVRPGMQPEAAVDQPLLGAEVRIGEAEDCRAGVLALASEVIEAPLLVGDLRHDLADGEPPPSEQESRRTDAER